MEKELKKYIDKDNHILFYTTAICNFNESDVNMATNKIIELFKAKPIVKMLIEQGASIVFDIKDGHYNMSIQYVIDKKDLD